MHNAVLLNIQNVVLCILQGLEGEWRTSDGKYCMERSPNNTECTFLADEQQPTNQTMATLMGYHYVQQVNSI